MFKLSKNNSLEFVTITFIWLLLECGHYVWTRILSVVAWRYVYGCCHTEITIHSSIQANRPTGSENACRRSSPMYCVIGFNHGLPWCVKYMARGPPVTTKPDGEAGGFCGDRGPEGHVFHTSRQAMIKTYYSTSIRKNMVQNCIYLTQMKSTTTAIDDSNRRWNKLGLGCSREATAPLILIFKSLFLWLNIGRHFKGITQFHNCHSPKHTSKKYYLVINIFRKICTKIIT